MTTSVTDHGAVGDGIADDTAAIQRAIDEVAAAGGGTVRFPPGIYMVSSVTLQPGITYDGYDASGAPSGATIKKLPRQDKWSRTFSAIYDGPVDSAPLVIQGLAFDGNSRRQRTYRRYQLQQQHMVYLESRPESPGRLRAIVRDCRFTSGVADGVSVYTNAHVTVERCEAVDVFRGGVVLTGGNSILEVSDFTSSPGPRRDRTGIDIEVDGAGFGGTYRVDVTLERVDVLDGDFDVGMHDGSTVVGDRIYAEAPFNLFLALVTRDALIGVARPVAPEPSGG